MTAAVRGEVSLLSVFESVEHAAKSGEEVYLGDAINSRENSGMQLLLLDETVFTVGANTEFTVDEFVYDPATGAGNITTSLAKGVLRFVTGNIAQGEPQDIVINLPVGTIGIRGTFGVASYDGVETVVILARQGTIDKYMGDCIMAFWNAPLDDAEHAQHACSSALEMMIEVDALNVVLEAEAKDADRRFIPIIIGIGLNSGECCVGNMGSDQRFDYSVLGDDVNLASRLEGQSKTYGVDIVIGENTYRRASEFAYVELDIIKVKGKNDAVRIYALVGEPEVCATAEFIALAARHADMLVAYRAQEWDKAQSIVTECRALDSRLNKLYDLHDDRIEAFQADPPGADWDGVFVATSK